MCGHEAESERTGLNLQGRDRDDLDARHPNTRETTFSASFRSVVGQTEAEDMKQIDLKHKTMSATMILKRIVVPSCELWHLLLSLQCFSSPIKYLLAFYITLNLQFCMYTAGG